MKKIFFLSIISLAILTACGNKSASNSENATPPENKQEITTTTAPAENSATPAEGTTTGGNLAYLLKLNGKYPREANVLENDPLKSRLKGFLKDDFMLLEERLVVSEPINSQGDIFFASGCMPHSCTIEECAIAVDVKNDNVFVAILQDSKATIRAEKPNTTEPEVLKKWVAEKSNN